MITATIAAMVSFANAHILCLDIAFFNARQLIMIWSIDITKKKKIPKNMNADKEMYSKTLLKVFSKSESEPPL